MPTYQISEPHPTALPNHYIHTGRGGAGNTIRVAPSTAPSASGASLTRVPSSHTSASSSSIRSAIKASTGRGGAGNIYPQSSLSHFSLADEMDAQTARERGHELWHVGRGGAGNFASQAAAAAAAGGGARKMSSGSEGSSGGGSVRSGFLGRLSGAFERR